MQLLPAAHLRKAPCKGWLHHSRIAYAGQRWQSQQSGSPLRCGSRTVTALTSAPTKTQGHTRPGAVPGGAGQAARRPSLSCSNQSCQFHVEINVVNLPASICPVTRIDVIASIYPQKKVM